MIILLILYTFKLCLERTQAIPLPAFVAIYVECSVILHIQVEDMDICPLKITLYPPWGGGGLQSTHVYAPLNLLIFKVLKLEITEKSHNPKARGGDNKMYPAPWLSHHRCCIRRAKQGLVPVFATSISVVVWILLLGKPMGSPVILLVWWAVEMGTVLLHW